MPSHQRTVLLDTYIDKEVRGEGPLQLIEDVSAVLDELCTITDWKMLGEELQVPHQVLHNIDSNNPKAERKIVATIHTWFNITEKPCWEMVVRALKRMLSKKPA